MIRWYLQPFLAMARVMYHDGVTNRAHWRGGRCLPRCRKLGVCNDQITWDIPHWTWLFFLYLFSWPEVNFGSPTRLKVHLISFVTFTKKSLLQLLCNVVSLRSLDVMEIDFCDQGFDCLFIFSTWHTVFHVFNFPFPCRFGTAVFFAWAKYIWKPPEMLHVAALWYICQFAKTNIPQDGRGPPHSQSYSPFKKMFVVDLRLPFDF